MANSAQARKRARQAEVTNHRNAEPSLDAAHRRQEGPQGDCRRRQDRRAEGVSGVAGGDRPHLRQEDHPQELRVADEVASRARHQGARLAPVSSMQRRAPHGRPSVFRGPKIPRAWPLLWCGQTGRHHRPATFDAPDDPIAAGTARVWRQDRPETPDPRRCGGAGFVGRRPPSARSLGPRRHRVRDAVAAARSRCSRRRCRIGAARDGHRGLPAGASAPRIGRDPARSSLPRTPRRPRSASSSRCRDRRSSCRADVPKRRRSPTVSKAKRARRPIRSGLATALLVRSAVQSSIGDAGTANAFAHQANALLQGTEEPFLTHWSLMAIGTTARARGRREEAMGSLHEALALAERIDLPYRRSSALYQLSVLHLDLKQGDRALEASLDAWKFAEVAGSAYAMVNARMAESAALELLDRPERELAAMQEALAIAHKSQSKIAESRALVNLSDIMLRRHRYRDAHRPRADDRSISRSSSTTRAWRRPSKANMGFALFGLGRVPEGKRLTDEALAGYERTGATSEIAGLLGEYGQYLERAGDHKSALALFHRERKLNDEIALAAHERTVLELQEKYESDKRRREIELLNRENDVKTAELRDGRAAAAGLVAARRPVRDFVRRRRRPLPEAADDQPSARREEPRAVIPEQPRSADRALQPPLFPGLHRRDQRARRGRRAPPRRRQDDRGAAADRPRPLQGNQRPVRARRGRRRPGGRCAAAARDAARGRHDRALGRRGIPGLRRRHAARKARRDRAAHHAGHMRRNRSSTTARRFRLRRRSASCRCRCRRARIRCRGSARSALPTWRSISPRSTAAIVPMACASSSTATTRPLPPSSATCRRRGAAGSSKSPCYPARRSPSRCRRRSRRSWPARGTDRGRIEFRVAGALRRRHRLRRSRQPVRAGSKRSRLPGHVR